jgi:hypothetical protein
MSNEIEAVIKISPTKKSQGLSRFIAKFYQIFREELTQMLKERNSMMLIL